MENVRKSIKASTFQTRFNGENESGYSQTQTLDAMDTKKLTIFNSDKTCQTCKHWDADTVRTGESLSTLLGKCKEISKKVIVPNDDQWRKRNWLVTRATFGCNGYEQDGNL